MMNRQVLRITGLIGLVVALVLAVCLPIYGQNDTTSRAERSLEGSEISDLKELVKYDKTIKKLKLRKFKKQKDVKKKEYKKRAIPDISGFVQMLVYAAIIALIGFVIYLVFSNIKLDKPVPQGKELNLEDVENIENIGTKDGLKLALEAGNYREAVRMLFIQLLQVLVKAESIQWRPEKTNRHYLREMRNHDKVTHFRNLVMVYEQVWYGEEDIDKPFFDQVRLDFEKFYSTGDLKVGEEEEVRYVRFAHEVLFASLHEIYSLSLVRYIRFAL